MPENKEEMFNVPFVVYESAQSRMERANKRLVFAVVLSIILLFLTNAIWLWAWMQYDYVYEGDTTQNTVDFEARDGIANYIGKDGNIINGTDYSDDNPEENPGDTD